ncbi:hypothetical protein BDD12DRAFT_394607 [Trichophaea hybrida]|nr:hypothetical protein BDD12DRAFT_394607 [Trichophaea hybrida]
MLWFTLPTFLSGNMRLWLLMALRIGAGLIVQSHEEPECPRHSLTCPRMGKSMPLPQKIAYYSPPHPVLSGFPPSSCRSPVSTFEQDVDNDVEMRTEYNFRRKTQNDF